MKNQELLLQIRLRRQELGFSQEYLAKKLGISQAAYSKVENGKSSLTVRYLDELSDILSFEFLPKSRSLEERISKLEQKVSQIEKRL